MTNGPQLENGYLRIANELFDAILQAGFSKRELCVMLALVRQTYGYGKKTDDITVNRLASIAGIHRQGCSETLKTLIDKNCVLKRDGKYGYVLELQKNYRSWLASQNGTPRPKSGRVPKQDGSRPKTGRKTVPKRDTQKTTYKRQSLKDNPLVVPPTEKPAKPKKRRSRKAPADFEVTDALRQWAAEKVPELNIDDETETFRDHEFKDPKRDWPGAWRNWMKRAEQWSKKNGTGKNNPSSLERMRIANGLDPKTGQPIESDSGAGVGIAGTDVWQ